MAEWGVGTQGTSALGMPTNLLFQLLSSDLEKRKMEQQKAQRASDFSRLTPDQQRFQWLAEKFPAIARQEAEKEDRRYSEGQRSAATADQRRYEESINEREKLEAEARQKAISEEVLNRMREGSNIRLKEMDARKAAADAEAKRQADAIRSQQKPLSTIAPDYADKASALGMRIPGGDPSKLQYLPTSDHVKRLAQYTGQPQTGIVTDEDIEKVNQEFGAYQAGLAEFGQAEMQRRQIGMELGSKNVGGLPIPTMEAKFGPEELIFKDPAAKADFDMRVKMFAQNGAKNPVTAAYLDMKADRRYVEGQKQVEERARQAAKDAMFKDRAAVEEAQAALAKFAPELEPKVDAMNPGSSKDNAKWKQEAAEAQALYAAAKVRFNEKWGSGGQAPGPGGDAGTSAAPEMKPRVQFQPPASAEQAYAIIEALGQKQDAGTLTPEEDSYAEQLQAYIRQKGW